jgi:hypothetical protein
MRPRESAKSITAERETAWYRDLSEEVAGNLHIIHQHFDLNFTRQIIEKVIDVLSECYFRPRYFGFERYPGRNHPDVPLIFASNHSGMAFPWDAIILASHLYERFGYDHRSVRPLASPMLSESMLMNPYLHQNLWKIVGSVDASFLNFETMMHQKEHNLLMYPEGVPGIGKGFNRRYQLQRFATSFITMSIKYRTDVVPILTVNGEYINYRAYRVDLLNRIANKLGVPFLPMGPITLLLPLQPWVFYMGLPANLTYVLGRTIRPYEMTDKPLEDLSRTELYRIRDMVQADMQKQLDEAVVAYGAKPYKWREFFRVSFRNIRKFPYHLPLGWPLLFAEFTHRWKKARGGEVRMKLGFLSAWRILWQHPFSLSFYIPVLGWIPILAKGFRKVKDG